MADTKITDLTEESSPVLTDIMVVVDDPSGTPTTKKLTLTNLQTLMTQLGSGGAFYIGSPTSDGSWRIIIDSGNLSIEKRESSVWVQKGAFT